MEGGGHKTCGQILRAGKPKSMSQRKGPSSPSRNGTEGAIKTPENAFRNEGRERVKKTTPGVPPFHEGRLPDLTGKGRRGSGGGAKGARPAAMRGLSIE